MSNTIADEQYHQVNESHPPQILPEINDSELPKRSLLCKHYHNEKPNYFDSCSQTLQVKVLNRTKNIIAAASKQPLYDRKKLSFSTQTTSLDIYKEQFKQKFQQTSRDGSNQPQNPILYNSEKTKGEYVVNASQRRYETSEVFLERKLKAIIMIQAKIRQYNAIKYVLKLKQLFEEKKIKALIEQQKQDEERDKEKSFQLQRRIQPKTNADFELLYEEINTWVRQQKFAIDQANLPPEARQAALELLVEKQAKLIANIDQLKRVAIMLNKSDKISIFFKKTSEPRRWQIYDGSYVYVNTPYTVRAATLRNIYFALEEKKTLDERLDLLLQTKFILKEFDCELTRDTIRLIDQEADLLSRDRPSTSLDGLRKRIQTNFLQFCECPEFNPAVTIVLDKDQLIFRPNTLPIIEKMNAVKREAIGRLKNNELKKGIYGQMDIFKRQFGILGLSGMIRGGTEKLKHSGVLNKSQLSLMPQLPDDNPQLDEETQCFDDGHFCLIIDQNRFQEDGITYNVVIHAREMEGISYDVVGSNGAVWFSVGTPAGHGDEHLLNSDDPAVQVQSQGFYTQEQQHQNYPQEQEEQNTAIYQKVDEQVEIQQDTAIQQQVSEQDIQQKQQQVHENIEQPTHEQDQIPEQVQQQEPVQDQINEQVQEQEIIQEQLIEQPQDQMQTQEPIIEPAQEQIQKPVQEQIQEQDQPKEQNQDEPQVQLEQNIEDPKTKDQE